MKITTKGQVTIPQDLREVFGLLPNTEVEFVRDGRGGVRLEKRGVTPDIAAPLTLDDRRAGRDPGLDAAVAALAGPRAEPALAAQPSPAL